MLRDTRTKIVRDINLYCDYAMVVDSENISNFFLSHQ